MQAPRKLIAALMLALTGVACGPVRGPDTSPAAAALRSADATPPAAATGGREIRSTALGLHEGWRYAVNGPEAGMTSEFFFVDSLPGAPVQMTVWQAGEKVLVLEQLDREKPRAAAGG